MSSSTNKIAGTSVIILDKKFIIACPEHAQESLRCVAALLDTEMREIRKTGRVIGTDRIAIIAALNIIHELTLKNETIMHSQNNEDVELTHDLENKLSILTQKIDTVLYAQHQFNNSDNSINTIRSLESSVKPSVESSFNTAFEPLFEAPPLEKEYVD